MRHTSSGQFELLLPAAEAISLFTPEGERAWAPGWDPQYPAGEPSEASGTTFTTSAHGLETIWVILEIDRSGGSAKYSRVTPGHHAGTVSVSCIDSVPGRSTVVVSYDMTLLPDASPADIDVYSPERFPEMMQHWSIALEAYLESRPR